MARTPSHARAHRAAAPRSRAQAAAAAALWLAPADSGSPPTLTLTLSPAAGNGDGDGSGWGMSEEGLGALRKRYQRRGMGRSDGRRQGDGGVRFVRGRPVERDDA